MHPLQEIILALPKTFKRSTTSDDVLAGVDLSGKRIIVTGANTGIGYETARALASAGATVVLACRSLETGHAASQRIREAHSGADVNCQQLDLGSLPAVKAFVEALDDTPIDILVCNAGSMSLEYAETEQGFERTLGVCHIGHFLLVKLLMPKLLASHTPRVVMVSSIAHQSPKKLDFSNLPYKETEYSVMGAYGQAKLCNILMALELQKRYGEQGLTACSVHPGTGVSTDFGRESMFMKYALKLISPLTKNANQGAATSVLCAVHQPAEDVAARYFSHCQPAKCTSEARNMSVAKALWERTEEWISQFV